MRSRSTRSFSLALGLLLFGCGTDPKATVPQAVSISRNSTAAFSPTTSEGFYGRCGSLYRVEIRDERSQTSFGFKNVTFLFRTVPTLNYQYLLVPGTGGNAPLENPAAGMMLVSDIHDSAYNNDPLVSGMLMFQSASSSNIAFAFSMSYADGKVMSGTVNQPLVPGPATGCN